MKKLLFILLFAIPSQVSLAQQSADELINELLSTWKKHTEMNALLLKAIDDQYLVNKSASGGRTVGEQFAHMHNVRLMWVGKMLDANSQVDKEIDAKESNKKSYVSDQLVNSDQVIMDLLQKALKEGGSFGEMSAVRFMGYLIAHEAHTRGQIILAMKQSGQELPPQVTYGIWRW